MENNMLQEFITKGWYYVLITAGLLLIGYFMLMEQLYAIRNKREKKRVLDSSTDVTGVYGRIRIQHTEPAEQLRSKSNWDELNISK